MTLRRLALTASILAGALLGAGGTTLWTSEATSYFHNDPKACINCHIMQTQYDGWQKASHHTVAVCIDCHLPHEVVPKYVAKAENGYHHSKGFTLQDYHEPIRIKARNAAILQANCVHCHEDFVHDILKGSSQADETARCVHCHRNVGHGARG